MKKKQKVKIIIGIIGIVLLLGLGYFFAFQNGKENVPKFGTKQPEEKKAKQEEQKDPGKQKENTGAYVPTLTYYNEEYLSFLSVSKRNEVYRLFETFTEQRRKSGNLTCCAILGNVRELSRETVLFYLQTNENADNVYQVIINAEKDFLDIEHYRGVIADIEAYGGAKDGDNIEDIYVYGEPPEREKVEMPSLEEEQAGKEQDYQDYKE